MHIFNRKDTIRFTLHSRVSRRSGKIQNNQLSLAAHFTNYFIQLQRSMHTSHVTFITVTELFFKKQIIAESRKIGTHGVIVGFLISGL